MKSMMTRVINPWDDLVVNSKRRASTSLKYEFNWFLDLQNRFSFGIAFEEMIDNLNTNVAMRHIEVLKGNINGRGNIQLILLDKNNWQLFKYLCDNIMQCLDEEASNCTPEILVENRLLAWKKLFEKDTEILSLKTQMGLISELYFLKELCSEYSLERAINAWCGSNKDNQDFAINDRVYEIKSYTLTKSEIITISSIKQLVNLPGEFYLITIGLIRDTEGITIQDIVNVIDKMIGNNSELKTNFYLKLYDYGYYLDFIRKQNLYKFAFKDKNAYLINEEFPRIQNTEIDERIVEVKYKIDMSKCKEFSLDFYESIRECRN
ncbi:PD-(D/E)XK motif protein [Clostridium butyricum]